MGGIMDKILIVKRDGELELFNTEKLLAKINGDVKPELALMIVNDIEKELEKRFVDFYPNVDNLKDMLEKRLLLFG